MRLKIPLFMALFFLTMSIKAQQLCENELVLDVKVQDSRCSGNGEVKITPSSPSGHVNLTDVFYVVSTRSNLTLDDDELKNPSTQTEFFVPKGSYYVYAVALCNFSGNKELFRKGPFVIGHSYPEFTSGSKFSVNPPLKCGGTNDVSKAYVVMSANGGRPPFTITLTKYPAGYAEVKTVTGQTSGYYTFRNVIPGTYAGMIQDSCGNTILFKDTLVSTITETAYTLTVAQTLTPSLPGTQTGEAQLGYPKAVSPGVWNGNYNPVIKFTSYPAGYTPPVGGFPVYSYEGIRLRNLAVGNYTWELWNYCGSVKITTGSFAITTRLIEALPANFLTNKINITTNYGDGVRTTVNFKGVTNFKAAKIANEANNMSGRLKENNIIRLTFKAGMLETTDRTKYSIFTYPSDFDVILYGGVSGTDSITCRNFWEMNFQNTGSDLSKYPDTEIKLPFTHQQLLTGAKRITKAVIRNRKYPVTFPDVSYPLSVLAPAPKLTFNPTLLETITPARGEAACAYNYDYSLNPFTLVQEGIYAQELSVKVFNKQTAKVDTIVKLGYNYKDNYGYVNIFSLSSSVKSSFPYVYPQTQFPIFKNPTVGHQYTLSLVDSCGQTLATGDYTIPARGKHPARTMPEMGINKSYEEQCGYLDRKAYVTFHNQQYTASFGGGVIKLVSAPKGVPAINDTIPASYVNNSYSPFTKYFTNGAYPNYYSIAGYLPEGEYVFEYKDCYNDSVQTFKQTLTYEAIDVPYVWRDTPPTIEEIAKSSTGTTYKITNWEDCLISGYGKNDRSMVMRVYGHDELDYQCYGMGGMDYYGCPLTTLSEYGYYQPSPRDIATSWEYWDYYPQSKEQVATINVTESMESVRIRVYGNVDKFQPYSQDTSACYYKDYVINLKGNLVAFDSEITGGYRCPGASVGTGFITVKAKDGKGPFTFNLYASEAALIARNPLKVIDYTDATRIAKFSNWPATGNDRLYVEIVDKGHNRTINGPVMLQDLTNSAMISIAGAQRKCEGDDLQLLCVALGETTYHWKDNKDYESYARNPVITNLQETKIYSVDIKITGCDVAGVPLTVTRSLEVPVAPRLMFWNPDAEDNNWNNKSNWLKKTKDGKNYEAATSYPAPCSSVHIQSNQGGFYPALDPAHSTGAVGYPICDTIVYHYGAETSYPQYLQYKSARVQYNFGYYNKAFVTNGQPRANIEDGFVDILDPVAPLARTKWYSLAAPMKKMTGGDFGVGPYPMIYQRTLVVPEVTEPTPSYPSFTGEFATQNIDLSTGTNYNSLALWVPPYRSTTIGMKNHSTLENLKGILEIPYFDNPSIMQYRPLSTYNETIEKSTFQYYNTYEPHGPLDKFDEISRGDEAYRFVYENDLNRPTLITYEGQLIEAYTMPLAGASKGRFILVGNPFMSHINFDKLYAANVGVIENRYMMYDGGTYKTYLPGIGGELTSPSIPPLQAVILKVKDTPTENSIKFPMGGIAQGYSVFTVNDTMTVKSGKQAPTLRTTQGQIVLDGIVGDNHIVSKLLFNYPDFDNMSKAIYPANMSTKAETFFIDEKGIINQYQAEKSRRTTVALGLQSTNTGTIRLQFTKVGNLPVESVHLVDKELGTRTELVEEVTNYDFTHRYDRVEAGQTGLDSKRFELQIVYRATVGLEDAENGANSLSVLCNKHHLKVQSSLGLKGIELLDMQGRSVYADSASEYLYERELDGLVVGAYLVKVSFVDGTVSHKKIIIE